MSVYNHVIVDFQEDRKKAICIGKQMFLEYDEGIEEGVETNQPAVDPEPDP